MPRDVDIERIRVRVGGVEPLDARALAQAIAEGLAPTLCLGPGHGALESLAVSIDAERAGPAGEVANRAVAQILALVDRGAGPGVTR